MLMTLEGYHVPRERTAQCSLSKNCMPSKTTPSTSIINGATLTYEERGSGPALVFLHGHLLDSGQWDDQIDHFASHSRVLRYDARGFGQSALPPTPFAHHEDLRGLLDARAINRAVLIGCSGGGAIAIDAALAYPERVRALVLVGSALNGYRPPGPVPAQMAEMNAARRAGRIVEAVEASLRALTDGPRRQADQVNPIARARTAAMTKRLFARPPVPEAQPQPLDPPAANRLAELRIPTLIIVGGEDQPPIHAIAAQLQSGIAGARSVVLPDAGHHPNLEHPTAFNQILGTFLATLSGE